MESRLTLGAIAPESVMLAGAGRAILLQLANPAIGYGVARHSDFVANPLKRLHGTLSYIYALSNGTPSQQARVRATVHRAHRPVRSVGSDVHPAYDARDTALQLWVAATLYDSGMQVYKHVFPALSEEDAEAIYLEYGVLGTALGMPAALWPATTRDFAQYWEEQLAQLAVDDTIRDVAAELLAARNAPWWIKAVMPLARFLTIGLLPPTVRHMYGFRFSPRQDALLAVLLRLTSLALRIVPRRIRHAPMHFYLKRLS